MTKLSRIKPEWMERYMAREMTSAQLAELSGYAAPYIRRAIPNRPPKPTTKTREYFEERKKLNAARQAFHASIAHLPTAEIMKQACVPRHTAIRIRKRYAKK